MGREAGSVGPPPMSIRAVKSVTESTPTLEGAGVHLRRAFGFGNTDEFDPFLLFDDFRGDHPSSYLAGFPWHPHRGIETITYVLAGHVDHGDSLGNCGTLGAGDIQWMTAGSGIIHQEMPQGSATGRMWGFQLWANLPRAEKMMAPRYRGITAPEIPVVTTADGATVRIICGQVDGVQGPVREIVTDPEYLDVSLPAGKTFTRAVKPGYTVFAYVVEGEGYFDPGRTAGACPEGLVALYEPAGDTVVVTTDKQPVRFLLVSGKPLNEPVAWRGPIVMNTQDELRTAFEEVERGTFIKAAGAVG